MAFWACNGLAHHAWYYFAIFAGVVAALVLEPLPSPAIGVLGVTLVTVLARWVLVSPEDLAALEETLELLSDPVALRELREAEEALAEGDVVRGVDQVRLLRDQ